MAFEQLIAFSPNKGGTKPNYCLDNVVKGYAIQNKYGSAWEAWLHTEQHADRDVPHGVAVPIYYSYTVDLGDGPQNYGHINVQLPDGRVWSDGNYYGSIDAYMANHSPRFVGWGESVNDFQVIKGEDMQPPTEGNIRDYFTSFLGAEPSAEQVQYYLKNDRRVLLGDILISTQPNANEVTKAFADILDTKPSAEQLSYYTKRGKSFMFSDLAETAAKNPGNFTPLGREVYVRSK